MNKILIIAAMGLFSCFTSNDSLETVDSVDLDRYAGVWYEIALFPNSFEKGCSCTKAEYQKTEKGYIKVINSCTREKGSGQTEGKAFIVKGSNNTKLKVQFFWPFKGDYWILGLDDDYQWALVGDPSRKYLWILARENQMDEETYSKIVEIAKAKGFDTSKLVKTIHKCD